jgi:hypothetical protein
MGRGIRLRNTAHVYQSDFYPLTSLRSTVVALPPE